MVKIVFIFLWFPLIAKAQTTAYSVIISEIMSDPRPQVMLPDAEYIELYNRSNKSVSMLGWKLCFGGNERKLTAATIGPNDYLIVCEKEMESLFALPGRLIALPGMPAIVNTGQTLTLKSATGAIVHTVSFSPRWYTSKFKAEGGWSLEIIDPDNPCGRSENWHECIDHRGGTPGFENSVDGYNPDLLSPSVLRATMTSDSSVMLHFSENMDSTSLADPSYYSASKGLLHPQVVIPVEPDFSSLLLCYPNPVEPPERYTVTILNSLKDCAGNQLQNYAVADFSVPLPSDSFDLVINEIMFDPDSGMSEFIELYNRSHKVLDLSEFSLALADPWSGNSSRFVSLKQNPFLLFPGQYIVITRDTRGLPPACTHRYYASLVEQTSLFTLPNNSGVIRVLDRMLGITDELHYSPSMHHELLTDTKGISLERIDAGGFTNATANWQSAAASAGYATPGNQNSQGSHDSKTGDNLAIQPEVFSPDNDGIDDYATIHLTFDDPGYLANIVVFDISGRKIKTLATNSLLGTTEQLSWDGTKNDNAPADIGIYLVYAEFFNTNGHILKYKKVITLAR
jgi:hypothetical protein